MEATKISIEIDIANRHEMRTTVEDIQRLIKENPNINFSVKINVGICQTTVSQ